MQNKHLLKSIIFSLIVVIGLGMIVAINLLQNKFINQPVNPTPIADLQTAIPTQTNRDSMSLMIEKLTTPDQTQMEILHTTTESKTLIGLSLKIMVGEYRPTDASIPPFVLNEQLQQAGVVDQINKWSCEDQKPCSIDIALINISPGGFTVDPGQSLGLIKIDKTDQREQLSLELVPDQTQALTLGGESVTIEFK